MSRVLNVLQGDYVLSIALLCSCVTIHKRKLPIPGTLSNLSRKVRIYFHE